MSQEEHVFVALFHPQRALGVAPVAGERRIVENHVKLHFVPFIFTAADGVPADQGGVVELVQHGVHGGHAQDVLVAVKAV